MSSSSTYDSSEDLGIPQNMLPVYERWLYGCTRWILAVGALPPVLPDLSWLPHVTHMSICPRLGA